MEGFAKAGVTREQPVIGYHCPEYTPWTNGPNHNDISKGLPDVVNTVSDLEIASAYGDMEERARYGMSVDMVQRALDVVKANAPHITTDAGNYQTTYDATKLWYQMSLEYNAWGLIPKPGWGANGDRMDGWRVQTALTGAPKNTWVTEGGTLPTAKRGVRAALYTTPKDGVFVFESSMRQQRAGDRFQSVKWAEDVREGGNTHLQGLQEHVCLGLGTFEATYPDSFFPLDKCISSYAEQANCTNDYLGNAIANADVDIYGVDKHTAGSWADSYVNENAATVRPLTTSLIYDTLRTTFVNSGEKIFKPSKVILTGDSTWARLFQIEEGKQRYTGATSVNTTSFNGVPSAPGENISFTAASFFSIPIVITKDIDDQTAGVAPMYIPDFDYMSFWTDYPTLFHEAGTRSGNEILLGRLADVGMFRTGGQMVVRKFSAQAKIRDIS